MIKLQARALVEDIYKQIESTIDQLEQRWQHEREYEDFEDYRTVIRKELMKANSRVANIVINPEPFEVRFSIATYNINIFVHPEKMGWEEVR